MDANEYGITRTMTSRERSAWDNALRVARCGDSRDERDDTVAFLANRSEDRSVRAEQRGLHMDAVDWWRVSELYDVARKALI